MGFIPAPSIESKVEDMRWLGQKDGITDENRQGGRQNKVQRGKRDQRKRRMENRVKLQ